MKLNMVISESLLNEGTKLPLPLSPLLALVSVKDKFARFFQKKNKPGVVSRVKSGVVGKVLSKAEKVRAKLGTKYNITLPFNKEDATVYTFTDEQKSVLAEMMKKYGKELINKIIEYRVNILSQYQLIKKLVNKNKVVTSKDTIGISYDEYKKALDTGKGKIEGRGEVFDKRYKDILAEIKHWEERRKIAQAVYTKYKSKEKLDRETLEKLYAQFGVSSTDFKHSLRDLYSAMKVVNNEVETIHRLKNMGTGNIKVEERIKRAAYRINGAMMGVKDYGDGYKKIPEKARTDIERITRMLFRYFGAPGTNEERDRDIISNQFEEFFFENKRNFRYEFSLYLMRPAIVKELVSDENNVFKTLFEKLIKDLEKGTVDKLHSLYGEFRDIKSKLEFNDIESKVWKANKGAPVFSNKLSDYTIAYKDEDFKGPIYVDKDEKVVTAEKKIEAESKKFERDLATFMSSDDLAKLKKYRLINNLILIREFKDANSLFKDKKELEDEIKIYAGREEPDISDEDYGNIIKRFLMKNYDNYSQLRNGKAEISELHSMMEKNGRRELLLNTNGLYELAMGRNKLDVVSDKGERVISIEDVKELGSKIAYSDYEGNEVGRRNDIEKLIGYIKEIRKGNEVDKLQDLNVLFKGIKDKYKIDVLKEQK